jgi:hypothetical protein
LAYTRISEARLVLSHYPESLSAIMAGTTSLSAAYIVSAMLDEIYPEPEKAVGGRKRRKSKTGSSVVRKRSTDATRFA